MTKGLQRKLFLTVIALLMCPPFFLLAQEKADSTSFWQNEILSVRFHYGFVLAHHADIQNLTTGHTYGFEIDFLKQADGSKTWHYQYLLPQTGFIYIHLNLANPDVLGNADGLLYAMKFPFTDNSKTFQTSLRLGCGLGWLSKKFDQLDNHKNLVISSNLNAAIQINFEERIKFSQRICGTFDVGLTHFSNGAFKYPNLGVNNISASLGVNYALTSLKAETKGLQELSSPDKNIHYELLAAAGVRAIDVGYNASFFSSTLSFEALKQINNKRLLGIGVDVFYDPGLKSDMKENSVPFHNDWDLFRSGIYFGHEQVIGKTSIITDVGAYIYDQYKEDGMIYDRLGFKYRMNKKYFFNLTLKAHIAKADYVEWGVGMRI